MAMTENTIAWNLPNWITVTIMGIVGFMLVGLASKFWQQRQQQGA